MNIPLILGTGRTERKTEAIARFVHDKLSSKEGVLSEFIDVKDYLDSPFTIPPWVEGKSASKWRKIAQEADGFVFVVPEYNRSFPGEFKLLFDSAFKEYMGKPAIIVGVSAGNYGGVRVIQHLAPVLLAAGIEVLGKTVATSNVGDLVGEGSEIISDEKYTKFVEEALESLVVKFK
ncbi:hypothetical protein COB52_05755 [Candidatus Kaiserbacteria bacterium]|nr:MAG: hypothetical protein COB52_05755 [Candidatus Kaiserbacteria bacterium]